MRSIWSPTCARSCDSRNARRPSGSRSRWTTARSRCSPGIASGTTSPAGRPRAASTCGQRDRARPQQAFSPRDYRTLLASLAHDLKNPLTRIHARAQLLQRRVGRPEALDRAQVSGELAQIEAATMRMAITVALETLGVAVLGGLLTFVGPRPAR